jgi:hypothetical protein
LRVRNDSSEILNVTIMDLQPDWGISQLYPGESGYFEPLDPGQTLPLIPLQASLRPGYTEGTDVVKVFATVGTTNFRWLELPTLDEPLERSAATRGGPSSALDELLTAFSSGAPKTRNLNLAACPSKEWVTAQVELRVQKKGRIARKPGKRATK